MKKFLILLLFMSANSKDNSSKREKERVYPPLGGENIVAGDFNDSSNFEEIVEPEYNNYK